MCYMCYSSAFIFLYGNSDNMAVDMETGEIHMTSGWEDDEWYKAYR